MNDQFDIELLDAELNSEIGLLADLIVAASTCDAPLSRAVIDDILFAAEHGETTGWDPAEVVVPDPRRRSSPDPGRTLERDLTDRTRRVSSPGIRPIELGQTQPNAGSLPGGQARQRQVLEGVGGQ